MDRQTSNGRTRHHSSASALTSDPLWCVLSSLAAGPPLGACSALPSANMILGLPSLTRCAAPASAARSCKRTRLRVAVLHSHCTAVTAVHRPGHVRRVAVTASSDASVGSTPGPSRGVGVTRLLNFFPLLVWPEQSFFTRQTWVATLRVACLLVGIILALVCLLCAVDTLMQTVVVWAA